MQLGYRPLFKDPISQIEYFVLQSTDTSCLCMQSSLNNFQKLKRAYQSSEYFYKFSNGSILKPLSLNRNSSLNISSAVFENFDGGFLADFLKVVPPTWQYSTGKRIGRILCDIHSYTLNEKQTSKAHTRHDSFMEKLAFYISDLPHFKNDNYALNAISTRYDHFSVFKSVMRYGSLKHNNILISKDTSLAFLPSYTIGPGDLCEDFANLELESAGEYPLLCAGIIDGYFGGNVPTKFWMHFALYCAFYSLFKCGKRALKNKNNLNKMQLLYDRVCKDFSNFSRPIPVWYSSPATDQVRIQAKKHGL